MRLVPSRRMRGNFYFAERKVQLVNAGNTPVTKAAACPFLRAWEKIEAPKGAACY